MCTNKLKGGWLRQHELVAALCRALEDHMLIERWKMEGDEVVLQLDRHTGDARIRIDVTTGKSKLEV